MFPTDGDQAEEESDSDSGRAGPDARGKMVPHLGQQLIGIEVPYLSLSLSEVGELSGLHLVFPTRGWEVSSREITEKSCDTESLLIVRR